MSEIFTFCDKRAFEVIYMQCCIYIILCAYFKVGSYSHVIINDEDIEEDDQSCDNRTFIILVEYPY